MENRCATPGVMIDTCAVMAIGEDDELVMWKTGKLLLGGQWEGSTSLLYAWGSRSGVLGPRAAIAAHPSDRAAHIGPWDTYMLLSTYCLHDIGP